MRGINDGKESKIFRWDVASLCYNSGVFLIQQKGLLMKKWLFIIAGTLIISACANKDVYFNGAEGFHSGVKFDKDSRQWGLNQ